MNWDHNLFNRTNSVAFNEVHVRRKLNKYYNIDLLTIFNNTTLNDTRIFMQLGTANEYPITKIASDILIDENMHWLNSWCHASDNTHRLEIADDTSFSKLLIKVKIGDSNLLRKCMYYTIELASDTTLTFRIYARNSANITEAMFPEFIKQLNTFIDFCNSMNIFMLPADLSLEQLPDKYLDIFDLQSFRDSVVYINLSIQDYWTVITEGTNNVNPIPRSLRTMSQLTGYLSAYARDIVKQYNILYAPGVIKNHYLLIYLYRQETIMNNWDQTIAFLQRLLRKAHVGFQEYQHMFTTIQPLRIIRERYPNLFAEVDKKWARQTYAEMIMPKEEFVQNAVNLFGFTIYIMMNNITVLGITNIESVYTIETALQYILQAFVRMTPEEREQYEQVAPPANNIATVAQTIDAVNDFHAEVPDDNFDLNDIDFNDLFAESDIPVEIAGGAQGEGTAATHSPLNDPNNANNATDALYDYTLSHEPFDIIPGWENDDGLSPTRLREIKQSFYDYELEVMENDMDPTGGMKGQTAIAHLKKFVPEIQQDLRYTSSCQSDKKPILITIDEYRAYKRMLYSVKRLTPFAEYLQTVIDNAMEWHNPYLRYICCIVYDFHTRQILNPYCLYMDMDSRDKEKSGIYYIPFATANDLELRHQWIPWGEEHMNRYKDFNIYRDQSGNMYITDPVTRQYIRMIKVYPDVSRFHCVNINSSKNFAALPYKFAPNIIVKTNLPCCFSKQQVVPSNPSNYNTVLKEGHDFYRFENLTKYSDVLDRTNFDGVNRVICLPEVLNILFNNMTTCADTYVQNIWARRTVYQGYFISLFDFILTDLRLADGRMNGIIRGHTANPYMAIYLQPIYPFQHFMEHYLTDEQFANMRNGLIRQTFETKQAFFQYCRDHYWQLDETMLWEAVSELLDTNIFILERLSADEYDIVYPQGYDINNLYKHARSMFVYKYKNHNQETIYDLIDKADTMTDHTTVVHINGFKPFLATSQSFVQDILNTLRASHVGFTPSIQVNDMDHYVPTALEFKNFVQDVPIVGQMCSRGMEYTTFVIVSIPQIGKIAIPVLPITLLTDVAKVNESLPLPSKTVVDQALIYIRERSSPSFYQPVGYIQNNQANQQIIGYQFTEGIQMFFQPIDRTNSKIDLSNSPEIQLLTLYYTISPNMDDRVYDVERQKHTRRKIVIQSLVHSIESLLISHTSQEWIQYLRDLFTRPIEYKELGKLLYNYVEKYVDAFSMTDPRVQYRANTSKLMQTNILTDDKSNIRYRGNALINCYNNITEHSCAQHSICRWDTDKGCVACFRTAALKHNVVNYIANELLSSFDTLRYRILYNVDIAMNMRGVRNDYPDKQVVINAQDADHTIDIINRIIQGEELSEFSDKLNIAMTLTSNFNDVQKRVITTLLQSLRNQVRPDILYPIIIANQVFAWIVNMNTYLDFWFTAMIWTARETDIVQIDKYRKALSNFLTDAIVPWVHDKMNGSITSLFDLIDWFLSADYMPSYLDFHAIANASWNPYNVMVIQTNWTESKILTNVDTYDLIIFPKHNARNPSKTLLFLEHNGTFKSVLTTNNPSDPESRGNEALFDIATLQQFARVIRRFNPAKYISKQNIQ